MGNYSKLIGSIVGTVLSYVVAKFALPAEWASPSMVAAVTLIVSAAAVYIFPANKPGK